MRPASNPGSRGWVRSNGFPTSPSPQHLVALAEGPYGDLVEAVVDVETGIMAVPTRPPRLRSLAQAGVPALRWVMMVQEQHDRYARGGHTVERERWRFVEHLADALATVSRSLRLAATRLDRDALISDARRRTGLEDTGDDRFGEGLDRILAESAGRYSGLGDALLRSYLARGLQTRLRSVDYIKRHPDVLQVPIEEPIVILGLPRSGTTAIQNLLAASPANARLEFWELASVVPVDEPDAVADRERRIRDLARVLRAMNVFAPELDSIHHATPTTSEEDWHLLVPSFHALVFQSAFGLEAYGRWLQDEADMDWAYGELKQRLQIILHRRPRQRLVLKCPDHLWFLDALMGAFPDARIVQTRRDPVECIASYASMVALMERTLTGRIEWEPLATRLTDFLYRGAQRGEEARARHDDRRFRDVPFDELMRDPAGVVRRVSQHFGLVTPSDRAIRGELERPRADQLGSHRYSHRRLGLEPAVIHRRFGWPGAHATEAVPDE